MIRYCGRRRNTTDHESRRRSVCQNLLSFVRHRKRRSSTCYSISLGSIGCWSESRVVTRYNSSTRCSCYRICSGRLRKRIRNSTLINYFTFKKLRSIMMSMGLLLIHKNEVYEGSFSPSSQNYLSGAVLVVTSFIINRRKICLNKT